MITAIATAFLIGFVCGVLTWMYLVDWYAK